MASTTLFRQRHALAPAQAVPDRERWARRRIGITWGLLFLNALTFYPGISAVHIPSIVGKGVAQIALPAAFLMALSVNRRLLLRPNVLLCLVGLLAIEALIIILQAQHIGTVYRGLRLVGYTATLWLLTPWWGRRDLLLVRCHLVTLAVLLGSVLLVIPLAPGHALPAGRLTGAIWPIPSTEVAHYAAIAIGLSVVLWFCGHMRGWPTLVIVTVGGAMLLLTHTRTALVGLIVSLLVAGLSLILAKTRVRKVLATAGIIGVIVITTLSSAITTWLARGENATALFNLSGRTKVWEPLLAFPRDKFQELFGFGLSNSSFGGLPIDSNWFSSYQEQGLFGVTICAIIIVFLLVNAFFQPRGAQRALALFLVTYCLIASFTEVGFTDVSPYLLDIVVAASLLVPPWRPGNRDEVLLPSGGGLVGHSPAAPAVK